MRYFSVYAIITFLSVSTSGNLTGEEYIFKSGPLDKHKMVLIESFESTRSLYSYIPLGDISSETLPLNPTLFAPLCLNNGGMFYILQNGLTKPIMFGSFYDFGRIRILTQIMVAKGQKAKVETKEKTNALLEPLRDKFARSTRKNSSIAAVVVHPSIADKGTLPTQLEPLGDSGLLISISDRSDAELLYSEAFQAVDGIEKVVKDLDSLLKCRSLFH